MKKLFSAVALYSFAIATAQNGAPASPYYDGFNFQQTGINLRNALTTKITATHVNTISYDEAREALKITDLESSTSNNVLLLYGWANGSGDVTKDRTRSKSNFGGGNGQWNREHTYAKSQGTPALGTSGPGADAHHLRASDVRRNGNRGNKDFAAGQGFSGDVSGGWYPGDEWKGDVARMIMYMYVRYGNRCLPTNIVSGSRNSIDSNMVNLLLQWNAEDPVSEYEDRRNTYLGNASNTYGQGNRNPFIDNPYLATMIWGGPAAQNRWQNLSSENFDALTALSVYPNPSNNHRINIDSEIILDEIQLISTNGQIIQKIDKPTASGKTYTLENLPSGFYFLKISSENITTTKKILVN
ncbi:T9SS type A sorting domain-containing protein [Flavobacterium sp. NST-5]|uniref:T9SS type A sorting domain-containing protein n=1 Tax=Flavobacterium ichthyis TaxID=2698827 RepID=A0ABW9Z5X1_9FLAO|nr:endonuclease [Flavobacterium ichthyis]NBL64223.1 T9SS type A sorting domain-containing protein [Flavobacterium ichthyis]